MSVSLQETNKDGFTLKLFFRYSDSMLEGEEGILETINEAGAMATGILMEQFDSDGSPIKIGNQTFTTKGKFEKNYQTPYGESRISRHVYQSHSGGKTFCPLEHDARIIITSTPKFAKTVSSKYSYGSTENVKKDFLDNHGRPVNRKTLQKITEAVGSVALVKESSWEYVPIPEEIGPVAMASFGIDGTCVQMRKDGWREAMTGTIALYNKEGNRLHTTYIASSPEYGKEKFLNKMENKINKTKKLFPNAETIGLADGAKDNWPFLKKHTKHQVIDFYHATGYLGSFSKAAIKDSVKQREWMDKSCHRLKHVDGAELQLLKEMEEELRSKHKKENHSIINKSISYFRNNRDKMKYKKIRDLNAPIGSGVTEAACKVIVKERMCKAGMRWKTRGADIILKLRSMNQTAGHWNFFWNKINKYGFDMAS